MTAQVTNESVEGVRLTAREKAVARKMAERHNRHAEEAVLRAVRLGNPVTEEMRQELLGADLTYLTADADLYLHLRFYGYDDSV